MRTFDNGTAKKYVHSIFVNVPHQDVRFQQIQAGNPRGSEGKGVDKKQCQSTHSEWTIDDKPYKPTTNAKPSNEINPLQNSASN